jgi:dipeptidyl aminopeptidase/acylaminoacyl peptidase
VEYLHWSPDGRRLLLGVAGHGADVAGGEGAIPSKTVDEGLPSWMPSVHSGSEEYCWRRAWIYELASNEARAASPPRINIWESTWCGVEAIAAVTSPGPSEGLWYSARLQLIDERTGIARDLFTPHAQLGCLAASPSGRQVAIVEAICSDRGIVAGELRVIDAMSGRVRHPDTGGVDITYVEWLGERRLLLSGHRGFETVVGLLELGVDTFTELWRSAEETITGRYASVSGCTPLGDCVLAVESFTRAPEIGVIRAGVYRTVHSLSHGDIDQLKMIGTARRIAWQASDGLELQGWLLQPDRPAPHPVVMYVHGGPVWHWRPTWLGRAGVPMLMLLKRGYAVFLPNPRGSSARGLPFARHVLGDMGGADTHDCLSGLDHLISEGLADAGRLGVSGMSYGGFMSAWLITQTSRFSAAVPVAPFTNQVTEYFISNIPHFVALFLGDAYSNPCGKYIERSPLTHAHQVKTPTLQCCGALDRCTPPVEALQFHNALLEAGVESVLVTYPEEGHGIRKLPAAIDYAARVVAWFESHM